MIVVNYYREQDYNPDTDGYTLHLAGIVNDNLDLNYDIELITLCLDNDPDFEPKNGVLYEIQLVRGTIAADPIPEDAFAIKEVIEKFYDKNTDMWIIPLVKM